MNILDNVSLKKQFERRQAAWKPNMDIVEDAELYRVDGFLSSEYVPPNATNEHEMVCWQPTAYQEVMHGNDSECTPAPPPPRPPLLGRPRPPIVVPFECGDVYCYPLEQSSFDPGKVYNYRDDEWCENPLVPKLTYQQQSVEDWKNAGVDADDC